MLVLILRMPLSTETRWGQALEARYFPVQNTVEFSKVRLPLYCPLYFSLSRFESASTAPCKADCFFKIQYAGGPVYVLALLGFELSLLGSYHRLASVLNYYRWTTRIVAALVTINQIVFALVFSLGCHPVAKQWNQSIKRGQCIDTVASYFGELFV